MVSTIWIEFGVYLCIWYQGTEWDDLFKIWNEEISQDAKNE